MATSKRKILTPTERWAKHLEGWDFVQFKEKHGTAYYSLIEPGKTKVERWQDICAAIVKERQDGWYPEEEPKAHPRPGPVDPNATLKEQEAQLRLLKNWEVEEDWNKTAMEHWAALQKAVAGDKAAAVDLIEMRRDYEYEGYIFHSFIKVKP